MADLVLQRSIPECVGFLRTSSRSDRIAWLAGLAAFPLTLSVVLPLEREFPPAFSAIVLLLALSYGSAYFAAARANTSVIPLQSIVPSGARLGARIGTIVFLVGGGMVLLASVTRALVRGVTPGDFSWLFPTLSSISGIVFSALPTIALAALGASVRLKNVGGARQAAVAEAPEPKASAGAVVHGAVATFALCLLSPSILAALANRVPPPVAAAEPEKHSIPEDPSESAPPQANPPKAVSAIPAPPPFKYEVPAGFSTTEPHRLRVCATRPVPGLFPNAPAAFSPDAKALAYTSDGGEVITARNLVDDTTIATFRSTPAIRTFAWSPNSKRVFCICNSPTPFWVLDLDDHQTIQLPLRAEAVSGRPRWESDYEVRLFADDRQVGKLDLDSLRFDVDLREYSDSRSALTDPLPSTGRCKLRLRPRPVTATTPLETRIWRWNSQPVLYAVDQHSGRSHPLLREPLQEGTDLLISPDATKVVVITGEGSRVEYLDSEAEDTDKQYKATLPELSSDLLKRLSSQDELAAFVYAPMVNPLNGRVVGADTSKVRALVFLDAKDGDKGTFVIAESYLPIQSDDVVSSIHYWENGTPVLLVGRDLERWWSNLSVEKASSPQERQFPSRHWGVAGFRKSEGGYTFVGYTPESLKPTTNRIARQAFDDDPPPQADATPGIADDGGNAAIERFVRAHHSKVGQRDIEGFVRDYADAVELGNKGVVNPDSIRKDQAQYLPRYDQLSETLVGNVTTKRTATGWTASYVIRSYAIVKRDGSVSDRKVAITLGLREAADGGFRIGSEQAKAAD